ncbi:MAG: tautomerase family protein, partial [Acidimicrobiia bacterium]
PMPIYRCTIPQASVSDEHKEQIALEITRIHCEACPGTPQRFVHVVFEEVSPGNGFCGGQRSKASLVHGTIRGGRDQPVRSGIVTEISRTWSKITGQSEDDILALVIEVPAGNVVEGGAVMPEPGQEAAWLAEHSAS